MVIGHDDVDAKFARADDFLLAQATTVNSDDQLRTATCDPLDRVDRHAIAFDEAIRYERIDMRKTETPQCVQQHCCRSQSVDVIIAVNRYFVLPRERLL